MLSICTSQKDAKLISIICVHIITKEFFPKNERIVPQLPLIDFRTHINPKLEVNEIRKNETAPIGM